MSGGDRRSNTPYFSWDPTYCLVVEPGIRLHTRWFCLQDGGGIKVEFTGLALEDRVRNVVVTRLAGVPVVTGVEPFRFAGPGLRGEAPKGSLERAGDGYRIRLG